MRARRDERTKAGATELSSKTGASKIKKCYRGRGWCAKAEKHTQEDRRSLWEVKRQHQKKESAIKQQKRPQRREPEEDEQKRIRRKRANIIFTKALTNPGTSRVHDA